MTNSTISSTLEHMLLESKCETKLSSLITNLTDIKSLLDTLPYIAALLDSSRRIVFANEVFTKLLSSDNFYSVLELLPGEAMDCQNYISTGKACGTSKACNYCGLRNAIDESKKFKGKITRDCVITHDDCGRQVAIDYQVTAATIILNGEFYTMVTLMDISHQKRRSALERIFFHDILNKAGSLTGLIDLIKNFDDLDQVHENIHIIDTISHGIVEEIEAQRVLVDAESGDLSPSDSYFGTQPVIESVKDQLMHHTVAIDKEIELDAELQDLKIFSDQVLLKRILINMVKNALEATDNGGIVKINCKKSGNVVMFSVHNNGYMPEEIQLQVFHRSFSTKGNNRGLGTYSMKLLGEQYLKGRVFFETSKKNGTTFYLALPVSKSNFEN